MDFTKLFFEVKKEPEEKNDDVVNQPIVVNQPTVVNQPQTNVSNFSTSVETPNIEINPELLNKLCSYIESCNLPGPDYMELKKAANNPAMNAISDIGLRFQVVYTTLKSLHPHLTKKIILDSIDTYISELQKQKEIAEKQIEDKRQTEVVDKNKIIAEKEAKIKKLQDEIVKISSEMITMKEEVQEAENECAKNKQEFNAAVTLLINNLTADKNKINETIND